MKNWEKKEPFRENGTGFEFGIFEEQNQGQQRIEWFEMKSERQGVARSFVVDKSWTFKL